MIRAPIIALALSVLALAAALPRGAEVRRAEVPAPDGINHGAAITRLASGGLLACWYSGRTEAGRDVRILCSGSADDGRSWSAAWTAVAPGDRAAGAGAANKSLGNVVLFRRANGRLWMAHGVIQGSGLGCAGWRCGRTDIRFSDDDGRTWSPATRLLDEKGALPRAAPVIAEGLGLLLPAYLEDPPQALAVLVELPAHEAPSATFVFPLEGARLIQPAFALDGAGAARAFLRDPAHRFVYTARFDITARRWSRAAPTNLPNPGAAIDVFRDRQGRFVLVYNPSSKDRRTLALARSADGITFQRGCDLVAEGADGDVAYPTVIGDPDQGWRVVWSARGKRAIRFAAFDEAWLEQCFAAPQHAQ